MRLSGYLTKAHLLSVWYKVGKIGLKGIISCSIISVYGCMAFLLRRIPDFVVHL